MSTRMRIRLSIKAAPASMKIILALTFLTLKTTCSVYFEAKRFNIHELLCTLEEAAEICSNNGEELAVIENEEQLKFVSKFLNSPMHVASCIGSGNLIYPRSWKRSRNLHHYLHYGFICQKQLGETSTVRNLYEIGLKVERADVSDVDFVRSPPREQFHRKSSWSPKPIRLSRKKKQTKVQRAGSVNNSQPSNKLRKKRRRSSQE